MKGMLANGMGVSGVGAVNTHPSDCSRSAEPEDDVEARLPCYNTSSTHCIHEYKSGSHLDHSRTSPSSDDCSSRAHVEGVVPIPACAHNVDHKVIFCVLHGSLESTMSQNISRGSERFWPALDAIDVKCGQECANLDRQNSIWREDMLQSCPEVVCREVFGSMHELA